MRRFELEVEVLGTLQHPSIARIYAAGTTSEVDRAGAASEVPYFVMELVRGAPLLEYVRRRALSVEERRECRVQFIGRRFGEAWPRRGAGSRALCA